MRKLSEMMKYIVSRDAFVAESRVLKESIQNLLNTPDAQGCASSEHQPVKQYTPKEKLLKFDDFVSRGRPRA